MQPLTLKAINKADKYQELLPQIQAVIANETDDIANWGNVCAMLKASFDWLWVGFYRVDSTANQLILGPFQGPLACTRIPYNQGVCGEAWASGHIQIVDDVNKHPNHIACSPLSRSEIVLPLFKERRVVAVLDIDAETVAHFDDTDKHYLSQLCRWLEP